MPYSVLILTLNEEANLPQCLESLSNSDDIVILDSFSNDKTTEVASNAGARIYKRKFDNYANQRMHGLTNITYKHPWLLMLDADELMTTSLDLEIRSSLASNSQQHSLYRLRRKDMFFGRWIKHSSGYPTWFGRLMKIGEVSITRPINEEYNTDGKVGYLEEHLIHHPFNKGINAWIEKHNRYSTMEAVQMTGNDKPNEYALTSLWNADPAIRRGALKYYVYQLPFRPLLIFIGMYIIKRGFLDGTAGFTFCVLRSYYEFIINCKYKELKYRKINDTF